MKYNYTSFVLLVSISIATTSHPLSPPNVWTKKQKYEIPEQLESEDKDEQSLKKICSFVHHFLAAWPMFHVATICCRELMIDPTRLKDYDDCEFVDDSSIYAKAFKTMRVSTRKNVSLMFNTVNESADDSLELGGGNAIGDKIISFSKLSLADYKNACRQTAFVQEHIKQKYAGKPTEAQKEEELHDLFYKHVLFTVGHEAKHIEYRHCLSLLCVALALIPATHFGLKLYTKMFNKIVDAGASYYGFSKSKFIQFIKKWHTWFANSWITKAVLAVALLKAFGRWCEASADKGAAQELGKDAAEGGMIAFAILDANSQKPARLQSISGQIDSMLDSITDFHPSHAQRFKYMKKLYQQL